MIASPARSLLLPIVAGALFLAGCGTYRNATAYFNTYYNASKLFEEAVREMLKTPQTAKDSNYFAPYRLSQAAVTKFEKVIEKGSRVIQFHGESGYVEDAILMIGKAYLFQNETESAASKFRELLDNFPASDRRAEAKLWLAKALYQGKNDEEALTAAKELAMAAGEEGGGEIPGDILLEITMLEAQIYADRGEFDQAAATLARVVAVEGDAELKAVAQFQLGAVHEVTKEYAKAAEAFALVGDYSPTPAMRFNAKLREGVMHSMAGRPDDALETFDEVIAWPLRIEQSALVDLEIANAYWLKGDSSAAFTLYDIIDSTYKRTDAAARSYFKRGEIHEKEFRNHAAARRYYEKAKGEYPASQVTKPATERFTRLDHFLKTRDRLASDDSTLRALLEAPVAPDSSDTASVGAKDSSAVASAPDTSAVSTAADGGGEPRPGQQARTQDRQTERQEPRRDEPKLRPPPPGPSAENLSMRAIRTRPRHTVPDPEGEDAAGGEDEDTRIPEDAESALAGKMKEPPPAGTAASKGVKGAKADGRPSASPDDLRKRIAEGEYELGGIFFLDLDIPDSALVHYERLVGEFPASPLVPKALYALSEVHRVLGDTAAVDSLYDLLLAGYPGSDYAHQVRWNRGLDTAAAVETADAAAYREAEALLFGGDSTTVPDALRSLKELSLSSKDPLVAPKARYAVGWIYENLLVDLDSADAWYKALIAEYPSSVYASSAEPRVAVRGDTSKLKQYVKYRLIEAIPKPQKQRLGQVPKPGTAGRGSAPGFPGGLAKPPAGTDEDEYYNPEEDEEEEPDPAVDDDDEPQDPDDDPGRLRNR